MKYNKYIVHLMDPSLFKNRFCWNKNGERGDEAKPAFTGPSDEGSV